MEDFRSRGATLMTTRVVWFSLLMGQLMFLGVVLFLRQQPQARPDDPGQGRLMFYVSVGMLACCVPAGWFIRAGIFRAARNRGGLTASAYFTGNVILWAACEAPSFLGLINILQHHALMPYSWCRCWRWSCRRRHSPPALR